MAASTPPTHSDSDTVDSFVNVDGDSGQLPQPHQFPYYEPLRDSAAAAASAFEDPSGQGPQSQTAQLGPQTHGYVQPQQMPQPAMQSGSSSLTPWDGTGSYSQPPAMQPPAGPPPGPPPGFFTGMSQQPGPIGPAVGQSCGGPMGQWPTMQPQSYGPPQQSQPPQRQQMLSQTALATKAPSPVQTSSPCFGRYGPIRNLPPPNPSGMSHPPGFMVMAGGRDFANNFAVESQER